MPETPLVSVIIPCFNHGMFLRDAIDSVLAQTWTNREIIVVDDGSTDDSASVAAAYGSTVRFVRQAHRGLSKARVRGLAEATGSLVGLLDSDDRWLRRKLELEVPRFCDPAVGVVHSSYRKTPASHPRAGDVLKQDGAEVGFCELLRSNVVGPPCSVIVRRHAFDRIGGFDQEMPFGAEDWDLWIRMAVVSRVVASGDITAEYRLHDASLTRNYEQMFASMMHVVKKHRSDHAGCHACRSAVKDATRHFRSWYFEQASRDARRALASGDPVGAFRLRMRGLVRNPRAARRIIPHLVRTVQTIGRRHV
jgi:glycosyltransferase involved in cell wall biosynthesis